MSITTKTAQKETLTMKERVHQLEEILLHLTTAHSLLADLHRQDENRYKGTWESLEDDLALLIESDGGECGILAFYKTLKAMA
jgi:hypothetical protein